MKKAFLVIVLLAGIFVSAGIGEAAMSDQDFLVLCATGKASAVEAAIKSGANINARFSLNGATPLMRAAEQNPDSGVIAALLKRGADVNARDKGGRPALSYAALHNSNPEVVLLLLKNGADAHIKDQNGFRAIDYVGKGNSKLEGTEALRQLEKASGK